MNKMATEKEIKVREMDDPSKRVAQVAREIADKVGLSTRSVANFLYAKRRGYESYLKMQEERYHQPTATEFFRQYAKKLDLSIEEYNELTCLKRGFSDISQARKFYKQRKNNPGLSIEQFLADEDRFRDLTLLPFEVLDRYPSREYASEFILKEETEQKELINYKLMETIESLPERLRYVIKKRFLEDKTLKEIGKDLKLTKERIRQLEEEALRKLYSLAIENGLQDLYEEPRH